MLRLILTFATLLLPVPAAAAALPDDRCAVIIASRRDMAEVAAWVAANPGYEVQGLYSASNGFMAISGGVIPTQGWREEVARRKAAGRVPQDAFCSGRGLSAEIWSRDRGGPPPWAAVTAATGGAGLEDGLFAPFDARGLGTVEKQVLQAALASEGAYTGLLDGAWGNGSQAALDGWTQGTFGRDATSADAALLLETFIARIGSEGWGWADPSGMGVPVFLPLGRMTRMAPDSGRTDFEDDARGLLVIVDVTSAAEVAGLHAGFLDGPFSAPPYQLRRPHLWVTSVRKADGGDIYLRSDRRGNGWVTTLVAAPRSETADDLIVASIAAPGPPVLALPPGGLAAGWVTALQTALAQAEVARDPALDEAGRWPTTPGLPVPPETEIAATPLPEDAARPEGASAGMEQEQSSGPASGWRRMARF